MQGLDVKAHVGMATSFGSLVGDEGQAVHWALLQKTLSRPFYTWVLSTCCVPSPVPDGL